MASIPRLATLNDSNRFDVAASQSPSITSPTLHRERFMHGTVDPFIANLSPAAVLSALRGVATISTPAGSAESTLLDSIGQASQHERSLGIRVALLLKRLKDWTIEIQAWAWAGNGFEPPADNIDGVYWGSLPKQEVVERDSRVEQIQDELDALEVEDLKNYIRHVHLQPQTHRASDNSDVSTGSISYNRLADFNVLITAMIMQALPQLAQLVRLLGDWSLRLLVLKQIPGFLQRLDDTELALQSAWTAIGRSESSIQLRLTRTAYEQIKSVVGGNIADLATRIDAILDTLEGHDHSIPDRWIDHMEEAEKDYKDWVIEAERLVSLHEWQSSSEREAEDPTKDNRSNDMEDVSQSGTHPVEATAVGNNVSSNDSLHSTINGVKDPKLHVDNVADQLVTEGNEKDTSKTSFSGNGNPTGTTQSKRLFFMQIPADNQDDSHVEIAPPSTQKQPQSQPTEQQYPKVSRKPLPLHLDTSQKSIEEAPKSHVSTITSASSSGFTDMSSPQIFDASEIQYYRSPMDDNFPVTITRDAEDISSLKSTGYTAANRFKHGRSISAIEPMTRSRASSVQSQLTINAGDREERPRGSIDGKLHTEPIAENTVEAEDEFYDAPSTPTGMDASPILQVTKTRIVSDQSDLVDEPSLLRMQRNERLSKHVEDKMTAKISRLLTKIPAPIKLSEHPPEPDVDSSDKKLRSLPRQQRSVTPALTLSPVTSNSKSTKPTNSSSESGVRVYHLHQPGKAVPIKLFIRLVGAEDRVMVRVGGGWADLAEYLKEYAAHHGHRSISTNNFELAGLPGAQNAASSLFDLRTSPRASPVGTPSSAKVSRSFVEPAINNSSVNPENDRPQTPPSPLTTEADESSFVSLSGPKTKQISLSPRKKAWVDGMLNQARSISGSGTGNSHSDAKKVEEFGDLGKVGSTNRLFMKGQVDG